MAQRFVSIWFPYLLTDVYQLKNPGAAAVLCGTQMRHGRKVVTAVNEAVLKAGITGGMSLADARMLCSDLEHFEEHPATAEKVLNRLARWCIRYSPNAAVDLPAGILLDATGCSHLWGGDENYLATIKQRLQQLGFNLRIGMADTIGAAWALSRYAPGTIAPTGQQLNSINHVHPVGLRLPSSLLHRLHQLGINTIRQLTALPRTALRRRFGSVVLQRIDQAAGKAEELLHAVTPAPAYQQWTALQQPIYSAEMVSQVLHVLLPALCNLLMKDGVGVREANLLLHQVEGKTVTVRVATSFPSADHQHLAKLFAISLENARLNAGVEACSLQAVVTEKVQSRQASIWKSGTAPQSSFFHMMDRFVQKFGSDVIHKYEPQPFHWPERSFKKVASLDDAVENVSVPVKKRPIHLLPVPEKIDVAAPVPDYPPMHFRYKGSLHKIIAADGPERIEPEWWIAEGMLRDYYIVEDESGCRYWVFREGPYENNNGWYLHGFFA